MASSTPRSSSRRARTRNGRWTARLCGTRPRQAEKRKDARVAREFEIALPHELNAEQRLELTREFAQGLADRYGTAVDFAIHAPHGATDVRNHHAHLMMTTRAVTAEGLGEKTAIERENKWLAARGMASSQVQLREIRQSWEQTANEHLARAGLEIRIDHRSHMERGLEIEPTEHMGVHATQMERRGREVSRTRLDSEAARRNAELIREKPEQVLSLITGEKSVFDRRDVARALHRYIDQPEAFQSAFATVMASPSLVELQAERRGAQGRVLEPARYSTREMIDIERGMMFRPPTERRAGPWRAELISRRRYRRALSCRRTAERLFAISPGRRASPSSSDSAGPANHRCCPPRERRGEREGYRVYGAALSGKAAEGLEESSGIASRTLASWDNGWNAGQGELGTRDVLVIDEAGMVSSQQLASFIGEAERAGAKIVLVGDPEQLQPIQAGAAFRAVAERVGLRLAGGRAPSRGGMAAVGVAGFGAASHQRGARGLRRYGAVRFPQTRDEAVAAIVRDVVADMRSVRTGRGSCWRIGAPTFGN